MKILTLVSLTFFLVSCGDKNNNDSQKPQEVDSSQNVEEVSDDEQPRSLAALSENSLFTSCVEKAGRLHECTIKADNILESQNAYSTYEIKYRFFGCGSSDLAIGVMDSKTSAFFLMPQLEGDSEGILKIYGEGPFSTVSLLDSISEKILLTTCTLSINSISKL